MQISAYLKDQGYEFVVAPIQDRNVMLWGRLTIMLLSSVCSLKVGFDRMEHFHEINGGGMFFTRSELANSFEGYGDNPEGGRSDLLQERGFSYIDL